ncbi:putative nucleolar complex protein 14 [Kluyveromyces marxianus]
MGGSQLKNLKAALKANGLTGQTNDKKKSKKKGSRPKDFDKEERQRTIQKIREQFNPFDVKANRNKKIGVTKESATKLAVGKPGVAKQADEEQRRIFYEAKKVKKSGGIQDKRFGERNKNLTAEEVMLERFTKERQRQSSSKRSLFNLEDSDAEDDGAIFGESLTHSGKSLALEDDFDAGDLGLQDSDNDIARATKSGKRLLMEEQELGDASVQEPVRKKTKAEVMQEVIAKSKFYKHERQKAQEKLVHDIEDLDDDFEDIMSELRVLPTPKRNAQQTSDVPELAPDYDRKVKELVMEKRAAPADRTKTDEEIKKEYEEKQKELEQKRLDRMNGLFNIDDPDAAGVEDLGEEFWEGSDSEEGEYGEYMKQIHDSDDDVDLRENDKNGKSQKSQLNTKTIPSVPCPQNHEEILDFLEKYPIEEHPVLVKSIIKTYQPKLAEGNKERLGKFAGVLLRHILFLSNEDYSENVDKIAELHNELIAILKALSEKFAIPLSEECRIIINEIQKRFKESQFYGLSPADLVFFSLVGMLFSSSDHYHLIITPCLLLIGEFLEQIRFNTVQKLLFGSLLVRIAIQYQRISKRYIPEITYFLHTSFKMLIPGAKVEGKPESSDKKEVSLSLPKNINWENVDFSLQLHVLFSTDLDTNDSVKSTIFANNLDSLDWCLTNIWKDLSAFPEIISLFVDLLQVAQKSYATYPKINQLLERVEKIMKFQERVPLALQQHKPLAIPSNTPKFEENFNPEKKSYDPDKTRSELNKMKAQLKKERKFTMKEIRKDTRFEARQSIEEKKKEYAEYHSKMARIVNQISTEEGAEKNKYEREKKLRNTKR